MEYIEPLCIEKSGKSVEPSIAELYDYFREINEVDEDDSLNDEYIYFNLQDNNEILNSPISQTEIENVILKLNNEKASGLDNVTNEYIKYTMHIMIPLYVKLFNFIFDKGIIPEIWSVGLINPIFKNKGNPKDPKNYRAIALMSCLGKVFTGILNNRLSLFA